MNAPTIGEITAAAKASAQLTPRPSRAFWIEAIRAYIEQPGMRPSVLRAFTEPRGWGGVLTTSELRDAIERHMSAMNEATLRAMLVELFMLGAEDEDAARIQWGEVFGLCEDGS